MSTRGNPQSEAPGAGDPFLDLLGHELRTPLTAIRGSLGLLAGGLAGELPPKAERLVAIAVRASEQLARLVEDLLQLADMRAGRVTLSLQPVAATMLLDDAASALAQVAATRCGRVAGPPADVLVRADRARIDQVFAHLVANALKFAPTGPVTLDATVEPERVVFGVMDAGPGVPVALREVIFESFRMADSSDGRAQGGAGLGLALCREIVTAHGGAIWVEDAPLGAHFRFALPRSR